MCIKNIMITNMNSRFTAEYIANVLWKQEIAKVSSITLIPEIKNEEITNIVYINIDSYCETDNAYEFIYNMSSEYFIFCHDETDINNPDNIWILKKNTHNSGNLYVGPYTTIFDSDFFKYGTISCSKLSFKQKLLYNYDNMYEFDVKECSHKNERPIEGINNIYYSLDETLNRSSLLNEQLKNKLSFSERLKLEEEFENLQRKIKKWENTYNITFAREIKKNCQLLSLEELYLLYSHNKKEYKNALQTSAQKHPEFALDAEEFEASLFPKQPLSTRNNSMNDDESTSVLYPPMPMLRREIVMTNEEINELLKIK